MAEDVLDLDFDDEELVEGAPDAPMLPVLPEDDQRTTLHENVRNALLVLPAYFEFRTNIEGVEATDVFGLNSVLGSAIEIQVVAILNRMRDVWDPNGEWEGYRFERQAQTFPDVLLAKPGNPKQVALGIELKGWYLLSKEAKPSLRFETTPTACSPFDLIAVVPWLLSNVLSGTPVCAEPWVCSARYAAEYRNYWWEWVRKPKDAAKSRKVVPAVGGQEYPSKDMLIADHAEYDPSRNFGRLARVRGLMGDFVIRAKSERALGIPIHNWIAFLRRHSDRSDPAQVYQSLIKELKRKAKLGSEVKAARVVEAVGLLIEAWTEDD